MKHLSKFALLLCFSLFSANVFAQVNTNPSGGLTIKAIQIEDTGWAFVEFEEANSQIDNNCQNASTSFGTFTDVLWLDPTEAGSDQVYATLLALNLANKKVTGVTLYNLGSYCTIYALRH